MTAQAENSERPRLSAEAQFLNDLKQVNKEHVEGFIKLAQCIIGIGHIMKAPLLLLEPRS